jgi:hypothetical protein
MTNWKGGQRLFSPLRLGFLRPLFDPGFDELDLVLRGRLLRGHLFFTVASAQRRDDDAAFGVAGADDVPIRESYRSRRQRA